MADIDVVCRISDATGDWLYLNEAPYRLGHESFAEEATTWRRTEVDNPQVEGKWLVNALRDNIVVPLRVWVRGTDHMSCYDAVENLKRVLSQRNYTMQVTYDHDRYTYSCYAADFQVQASRELRIANIAMLSADIPRHPSYTRDGG